VLRFYETPVPHTAGRDQFGERENDTMTDIEPKKDLQIDEEEKLLPLVVEIMP